MNIPSKSQNTSNSKPSPILAFEESKDSNFKIAATKIEEKKRPERMESAEFRRGDDIVSIISHSVDKVNELISLNENIGASGKKRRSSGSPFAGNSNVFLANR